MKSRALPFAILLLLPAGPARSQGTSAAAAPSSKASRQRSAAAAPAQTVALSDFAIQSPAAGSSIRTPAVNVRIRARDDISSVFVNGIAAARDPDGGFVAVSVPLPEGPVVLTATGRDGQGRTRRSTVSVVADRTPPRLVVSDAGAPLESGAVRGRPVHPVLTVTDSSPVTVKATLNGKPFVTGSAVAQTGHYTLEVEAADRAGNVTRRSISFRIATRAPRLGRLEPASGAIVSGDAISVTGECDHASAVTVAGSPALLYGGRFVAARVALAPGSNSIEIVARDSAGNEARSTLKIFRDDSAPRLTVSSPGPGFLTREASVVVRGSAIDDHLSEVLVNGAVARLLPLPASHARGERRLPPLPVGEGRGEGHLLPLPAGEGRGEGRSGSLFEREVRLNEGPNRVVIVARDSAGNRAETYLDIIRDSTAPSVSIRTPGRGTVAAGPTIDVEGDCLDANLASVAINGIAAAIEGGRFRATRVPLSPGENTITATALDRAGNAARASVSVTRDDRALAVKLDLPETGAVRSDSLDLSGKLEQGSGVKLTVNGVSAEVSPDGQFRVPGLRLNEGLNTLTLRATEASGRTAVGTSIVTLDTVPLQLSSVEPADGAKRVASAAVVHFTFGKPIDPATANASTVRLVADVSGEPVPASLFVNGKDLALLPHAALADRTVYRVEVSDGVADLAGNRLRRPQSVRFETGSVAPPSTPALDAVPAAVCATSLALSGQTDPAARVRVSGAASPLAETVAGPDGRFSLTLRLPPETMSSLTIVASDAQDRSSRPVVLPVRTDCTAPRVESARLAGNNIEIVFSEPIDRASFAREGAVLLTRSPAGVLPTPRFQLDSEGGIARSEPLSAVPEGITTLTVSNFVTDLAGNPLPAPYVTRLASSSGRLAKETGDAGLSGQVFDDRIGRPLSGAVVTVVAVDGAPPAAPAPSTTTDGDGAFALVVPAGEVALRAAREGDTAVVRFGTAAASESITVFDFRLTPETVVAAAADGSASVADKELTLALPASSVAGGSTVRGTSLSPQGLPVLAPLGWSPAAALSLELGPVTAAPASVTSLPAPAAASWTNRFGYPAGTSLLLARYDADGRRFVAAGPATLSADATTITASIPSTGVWAVFVADPAPYAPPQPSAGQPLAGVTAPSTDPILSASVTSDPRDVLPTQTADITGVLALSAPLPSGYPVEVLVSETLTLVDSSQISAPSFLEDLTVLRDGTGRTIVPFRVRPSATAAQVALSVGYENLLVKRYTFDLRRGDLVGSGGGTVVGPSGLSVVIPPNALTQTVPVTLTPASAAELPVPVPAGYQLLAAVRLAVGGQELASPAALRWASDTDPTGNGLIWVEIADYHGVTRPRFAGPGRYDSVNKFVETTPAAVHNLPVAGVTHGGLFALLKAAQPIAWVKGRVLDVDASAVAAAVVSEDGTSVVAVTDGLGAWALPIGTTGGTVRSIRTDTGNVGQATVAAQSAGATATQDISLVVTAPYVVSVAPAAASVIPLDLPIVFTLSEPLNPSTVNNSSVSAVAGGIAVAATVRLSSSGTQLTVTPTLSWPGKSSLTLTLSSTVTDRQGYRLVDRVTHAVSNFVVAYTTVDPTPPTDINPLLIGMGLPTGVPPTVTIAGSAGAACPGCTVIAVNDTTTVTSSTTALSDGSFSMTLAAKTTDSVYLIVRRSGGGEIRISPGPFRDDGGRVAYLGPRAADYITRDGIRVTLDEGSYSLPVTLKVQPIAQTALPAPMPTQSTFIVAIEFDPGDAVSSRPIDLSVAAPAGVTGGQFLVARAVQVLGETKWMVVDTARYDNGAITTRPAPGPTGDAPRIRSLGAASSPNCPELQHPGGSKDILDRVTRKSNLILLGVQQQLAFVASEIIMPNVAVSLVFAGQYEFLSNFLPYIWIAKEARQQCYFAMPVPLNVPFSILGRDATSGLTVFQGNFSPVTDPTNVTKYPPDTLNGRVPAPRLISGSPFSAYTFVPAPTATANPPDRRLLLPKIQYSYVVNAEQQGNLILYGDNGAATPCLNEGAASCVRSTALSLTNNARAAADVNGSASATGSFTLGSLSVTVGDDVTFIAGTTALFSDSRLSVVFSQSLDLNANKPTLRDVDSGKDLNYEIVPDLGSRTFTLVPSIPLQRGHTITLAIPSPKLPKALTIQMTSGKSDLAGSRDVADVNALFLKGGLLLEVTGDAGNLGNAGAKLNLYDASDPAKVSDGTRCDSKELNEFARGVIMDDHDRVIVALGGGGTNGRVQVFRLTPYTGPGPCGGRRLSPDGTGPEDLDRAYTEVTIRAGAGDLGVLPEGFPRRLELVTRENVATYVVDRDTNPLPTIITTITGTRDTSGNQLPNSPVTIVGRIPDPAGNEPITVSNKTTGVSWTRYVQSDGSFTVTATASSRDRLEFRINGSEASLVGTLGFGIQAVDINKTLHFFGQPVARGAERLLFSFGRIGDLNPPLCLVNDPVTGQCAEAQRRLDHLIDLVLLPPPKAPAAGALPAPAEPAEATVLAAVNRFGLATFQLTGDGPTVRIDQLGSGVPVAKLGAPTYPVFSNLVASRGFPVKASDKRQSCSDGSWKDKLGAPYLPTLAFLSSTEGVFVVDVTKASVGGGSGNYLEPYVVGLFRLPSSGDSTGASTSGNATSLSLDASRGLLYVGSNDPGTISVYDMTDPCTPLTSPALANDPRRIASVDLPNQNPNTAFVVDHDTGVVFGAGDSSSGGNGKAFALSLFAPPLSFVADTDHDGQWEEVSQGCPLGVANPKKPASPYCPDVVRILASIWGSAGKEITVELDSATKEGATLSELRTGFPRTKTYVTLTRQSDDPGDVGYNHYLSAPIVLIADPRARKDYAIKDKSAEKDDTAADASKDYACHNCLTDAGYAAELADWAADTDGVTSGTPAKKAIEQWMGDKLIVRLAWDAASDGALKARATYLTNMDLQRVTAAIKTTRGDLTPELAQIPAQNPSLFTTEAGVAVDTHAGGARMAWTDLAIKGRGLDFVLSRYYVSDVLQWGPFGRNIDSPLFARLRDLPTGDVDFYPGDGSRHTFRFVPEAGAVPAHFAAPKGVLLDLYRLPDLSFELIYPDQTKLFFDDAGRLVKLVDRQTTKADWSDGNQLTFFYDGSGHLVTVTDPTNRRIQFDYNDDTAAAGSRGLIAKVTDFDGRVVSYTYDGDGRLTKADGPDPASASGAKPSTMLAWTPAAGADLKQKLYHGGELTSVTDGKSREVFHVAYRAGQPASVDSVTYGGGTWQMAYADVTTTVTDPNANARTYSHDDSGRPLSITEPGGAATTLLYDSEGRLQSLTRPEGGRTEYSYASASATSRLALGNVKAANEYPRPGSPEATLGQTRVTTIDYGPANLPTTVVADGLTTAIDRDAQGNPKTVTLPDNSTRSFVIDERGLLRSSTDGAGITQTYSYFGSGDGQKEGYLKTRTGGSATATYEVDTRGNVTNVQDQEGRSTTYQVNKLDQIEQEAGAFSQAKTTYNEAGQVVSRDVLTGKDAGNNPIYARTSYDIDELDRLKGRTESGGGLSSISSYGYDSAGNLKTVARTAAPAVSFAYDSRDRVTGVTIGSSTVGYGYDRDGVRTSQTSPRNFTTTYVVDGFGRRVGTIDPTQVKTFDVVDRLGRPLETRVTKIAGTTETLYGWTTREFDPLGRVTKEIKKLFTDPIVLNGDGTIPMAGIQAVTTLTSYDRAGNVKTVTDPLGRITTWDYADDRGRLTKLTDAAGNTIEYTYDNSDNRTQEKLTELAPAGPPIVSTTKYAYDGQNRLTKVTDPLNQDTLYEYDPRGNRTKTTDVELHVSTAEYDVLGRKTKETDANGGVTQYEYDLAGHLTALVDANTNRSEFTYDAASRLQTERRADGKTWTYGYDAEGNRNSITDPNGTTVAVTLDPLNRPTRRDITRAAGVLGPATVTWGLDPLGRVISSATAGDTADVTEAFAYDSLDRLLREEQKIGAAPNRVVVNGYDLAGNVNALTYASGLALAYDVDPLNRIAAIKQGGTPIATYRDVGTRPFDKALANGITQSFNYDAGRRLNEILSKKSVTTVADVSYTLSPLGNKQTIARPDLGKKATYTFNPNSWITQEALNLPIAGGTPERQTDYTVDKVLNYSQVQEQVNGAITATKNQAINNRNQYSAFAGSALTYDSNGNLTGGAGISGTSVQYDFGDRLKKASKPDGTVVENLYDASGRKVRESVTISGTTKTTDYVLAGAQVLEQYTGAALSARYVHGRGIDETVRAELDVNADGTLETTVFPLQDELGNVERLTDAVGATTERYDYQGYGKPRIFDAADVARSTSAYGWRWLFQGREYQSTLNAYDFRARELWPDLGRFGQEDPIGAVDSANLYQGFLGQPITLTDPMGLVTSVTAAIGPGDLLPTANYESGIKILDYTLFGTINTGTNIIYKVVNAGTNALAAIGWAQSKVEDFAVEHLGASRADIEALNVYLMTNPAEAAMAVNSLRAGLSQGTAKLTQLLQRAKQQSAPVLRSVGAAANEELQAAKPLPRWKQYELRHGGQQTPMETTFEGKTVKVRLDKPPTDTQIVDLKDYDWANPSYRKPFIRKQVAIDFTSQIAKYKTIRPNVHLQFSAEPPQWIVDEITKAGATYSVKP